MNFLTSALSSLTGTVLPYTLKEKVIDESNSQLSNSIWTIYNGVKPKDGSPVTVFEFQLKDPRNIERNYDKLARNAFKKAKLIKFPGTISIIDFIEDELSLYIVTEPVVPLLMYLSQHELSEDSKLFGLYNIAQTISFINMKCNCLHGNLNLQNSIYVNQLGEWKLFGFELLTNLTSDPDQPVYRLNSYLPGVEFLSKDLDSIRSFPIKLDSYLFGMTMSNVFNTQDYSKYHYSSSLAPSIPKSLANAVKKLVNTAPNLRITVEKFLHDTNEIFNKNDIIIFNQELDEIKFKNDQQKMDFFKYELSSIIGDDGDTTSKFPPGLLENKLLPELINQYSNISKFKPNVNTTPEEISHKQETISILLNFILKFGVNLPQSKFNALIKPIIFESFSANDRSIRLILLNHLPKFECYLNEGEIQSKIFYNIISGFQDTNFMIRETTLKSITIIIDKVSVKQVNQDLLKILAKSQMDPKPSIRVNTLILIIKISSKIYKTSRNNVLITALSKSLRDSFIPCKMTALSGFESLRDEFSLEEICSKILGNLAISLMDPRSSKVRIEAKRIFQLYLDSVEKHAAGLKQVDVDENEEEEAFFKKFAPMQLNITTNGSTTTQNSIDNNTDNSYGFGWGMVNKLVSASIVKGDMNNDFNSSTPDLTRVTTPTIEQTKPITEKWDNFDDEIDDSWDVEEEKVEVVPISQLNLTNSSKSHKGLNLSSKSTNSTNPSKSINLTNTRKTSLKLGHKPTTKPKPTINFSKLTENDEDDGGWGGDDW